jgi:hypothetical protein
MPTISQAKRQEMLLGSGYLDLATVGSNDKPSTIYQLSDIQDTMVMLAARYIQISIDKLNIRDAIASGALEKSIVPSDVSIFGKVYHITISLNDYYKFVDEGVKGWQDEKGSGSQYQFKKTFPSKKMVAAIRGWVVREGLKGIGKENAHPLAKPREQRRAKITDTSTRMAYAISYNIKKKGLRGTNFWSDTHKEMMGIVREELGKSLKVDIINILTNGNSN